MREARKTGAWFALLALGMAAVVVLLFGSGKFAPTLSAETEEVEQQLRVSAQRLEDGRVQFGVRVADGQGGWSDPIEPRVNHFTPSTRTANRWLSSSSLTLERVDESASLVRAEAFEATEPGATDIHVVSNAWRGDIRYEAADDNGAVVTSVSLYSLADGTVDGELRVDVSCDADGLVAVIGGLPPDDGRSARSVSWSVDSGRTQTERWWPWPVEGGLELLPPAGSELAAALLSGGQTLALSLGGSSAITTEIDLSALQATPVYSNLTACGASQTVLIGNTEVRIQAHLHQDGDDTSGARIEFALQQRGDDGEWGERILPRGRYMPAYGDPTNWLSSTPVSVSFELESFMREVNVVGAEEVVAVGEEAIEPITAVTPRLGVGATAGGIEFEATRDAASGAVSSHIRAHSNGPLVLEVSCVGDRRQVGLNGIPEDATDALSFALDDQRSSVSWASGAFDDERVIRRLAGASMLTIGEGSSSESNFDVSRLFSTPIQRNVDNCGDYTDPAWTPFTAEVASGTLEEVVRFRNTYGDQARRGYGLNSHISINGSDGGVIGIDCFNVMSPNYWVQTYVRPIEDEIALDIGTHQAIVGADGIAGEREWTFVRYSADGPLHISNDQKDDFLRLLRWSSMAFIEFNSLPGDPVRLNTRLLFGTPVQVNIDNCGQPLWPDVNHYVPFSNVDQTGNVRYHAFVSSSDAYPGTISTNVTTTRGPADAPESTLTVGCFAGQWIHFIVNNLPAIEPGLTDVSMVIGDREAVRSQWQTYPYGSGSDRSNAYILPDAETVALLSIAHTVSIEFHDIDLGPLTFSMAGLFDSPVQENLDNCVFYLKGETRELPPSFVTSGTEKVDGTNVSWGRGYSVAGRTHVYVNLWADDDAVSRSTRLAFSCNEAGPGIYFTSEQFQDWSGDTMSVSWQVDDGPTQSDTWEVYNFSGSATLFAQPASARAFISTIRDGHSLAITFNATSELQRFYSLNAMFGTPIQQTIDECVETDAAVDSTSTLVDEHDEGPLVYRASNFGGADAVTTILVLKILDDEAPNWAGYSSRLIISCTGSTLGVMIGDIGLVGDFTFADEVEVTWRAGNGGPQTETWDVRGNFRSTVLPRDGSAVFHAINGADSFSVSVASSPVFTETYEFADNGFWDTPVQPNLDACGGEAESQ